MFQLVNQAGAIPLPPKKGSKSWTALVETKNVYYPTGRGLPFPSLGFPPVSSRSASCLPASRNHLLPEPCRCVPKKQDASQSSYLHTRFQGSVRGSKFSKALNLRGQSEYGPWLQRAAEVHPAGAQAKPICFVLPCPALPCFARTTAIRAVPHCERTATGGGVLDNC